LLIEAFRDQRRRGRIAPICSGCLEMLDLLVASCADAHERRPGLA
jgi:hypothetical protein